LASPTIPSASKTFKITKARTVSGQKAKKADENRSFLLFAAYMLIGGGDEMREALSMGVQRIFTVRRGGNEVLRILYREPQGDSAAMRHMRDLIGSLREYAASHLTAEEGAQPQKRRYEISLSERRELRCDLLILTATLQINGQTVRQNTLITRWDKDGTYQLPCRRHGLLQKKTVRRPPEFPVLTCKRCRNML
jgi:hypothetical protein